MDSDPASGAARPASRTLRTHHRRCAYTVFITAMQNAVLPETFQHAGEQAHLRPPARMLLSCARTPPAPVRAPCDVPARSHSRAGAPAPHGQARHAASQAATMRRSSPPRGPHAVEPKYPLTATRCIEARHSATRGGRLAGTRTDCARRPRGAGARTGSLRRRAGLSSS